MKEKRLERERERVGEGEGDGDGERDSATEPVLKHFGLSDSERQKQTGATGDRFKESTKINQSLSTLGNVLEGKLAVLRLSSGSPNVTNLRVSDI